jgi:hypothetical protein
MREGLQPILRRLPRLLLLLLLWLRILLWLPGLLQLSPLQLLLSRLLALPCCRLLRRWQLLQLFLLPSGLLWLTCQVRLLRLLLLSGLLHLSTLLTRRLLLAGLSVGATLRLVAATREQVRHAACSVDHVATDAQGRV